jgi:putative addiction module killer protein
MIESKYEIEIFLTKYNKEPFTNWYSKFNKDTKDKILKRLNRIKNGNFGDFKNVGNGVLELRFIFGAGYRIYFGKDGGRLVILLCGGDKKTQKFDIEKAKQYWQEYKLNKQ